MAHAQGHKTAEALAYAAGVDAFMDGKDLEAAVYSVDPSMIEIAVTAYLAAEWGERFARDAGPRDHSTAEILAWAMGQAEQAAQAGASIRDQAEAIGHACRGPEVRPAGRVVYRRKAARRAA